MYKNPKPCKPSLEEINIAGLTPQKCFTSLDNRDLLLKERIRPLGAKHFLTADIHFLVGTHLWTVPNVPNVRFVIIIKGILCTENEVKINLNRANKILLGQGFSMRLSYCSK